MEVACAKLMGLLRRRFAPSRNDTINIMNNFSILTTKNSSGYELLDSGDGEKMERYGVVRLVRPDPQALWKKKMSEEEWKSAEGIFTRSAVDSGWEMKKDTPEKWQIEFGGLKFWVRPTTFKHTGIFPEQLSNWDWMRGLVKKAKREISVLNLFGYTGGATLACAQAGAKVCHVDGSKVAIGWARDNAEISGLTSKPLRWILDDVKKFILREIKRENKYDGIIMDPPAFGHGPNNELWKFEKDFPELLEMCKKILSPKPLFFLINAYASGYSAIALQNNLSDLMGDYNGKVEVGELAIAESGSERLLPCGIFGRWQG